MAPVGEIKKAAPQDRRLSSTGNPIANGEWMKALNELKNPTPAAPPPPAKSDAELLVDETLGHIEAAQVAIAEFVKAHPYLIAPNVYRLWEDHLQEFAFTMNREKTRAFNPETPVT